MVFIERKIESVPHLKENGKTPFAYQPNLSMPREQVLTNGTANTMIGVLSQMSILANYAHDIFSNLSELSQNTAKRISKLGEQIERVSKEAPKLETYFKNTDLQAVLATPRSEFALNQVADSQLFVAENAPKSVSNMYKSAKAPPALEVMDPYMDDNKKCLELYTNPRFFLDEWIAEQLKIRQAAKEERRKRREEKKRQKEQESNKTQKLQAKKPTRIEKVVYDPHTGEKRTVVREVDTSSSTPSTFRLNNSAGNAKLESSAKPPPSPTVSRKEEYTPPPQSDDIAPPPPPPSNDEFLPPPPPVDDFSPPPPPPATDDFSAPPPPSEEIQSPPPPPPSGLPPPPPPPGPPVAPQESQGQVGPNKLLSELSKMKEGGLKKVEDLPAPKKVDAHSDLLNAIKSGQALRKTQPVEREKKESNQPKSVAEILSRRIAIAPSDSEDDDEDWEDDWD